MDLVEIQAARILSGLTEKCRNEIVQKRGNALIRVVLHQRRAAFEQMLCHVLDPPRVRSGQIFNIEKYRSAVQMRLDRIGLACQRFVAKT